MYTCLCSVVLFFVAAVQLSNSIPVGGGGGGVTALGHKVLINLFILGSG